MHDLRRSLHSIHLENTSCGDHWLYIRITLNGQGPFSLVLVYSDSSCSSLNALACMYMQRERRGATDEAAEAALPKASFRGRDPARHRRGAAWAPSHAL